VSLRKALGAVNCEVGFSPASFSKPNPAAPYLIRRV
jgi:hypothetical protein